MSPKNESSVVRLLGYRDEVRIMAKSGEVRRAEHQGMELKKSKSGSDVDDRLPPAG